MSNTSAKIGVGGEYIVKIIDKDGNERLPFGEKPNKNLILDVFFEEIFLNGGRGYEFGMQAFMQSCRVGDSNAAPVRTQTGLQGNLLATTHRGSVLWGSYDGTHIIQTKDFIFDTNNTGSPITYREALVGCFGSSVPAMDITVSRFVFPADVVIRPGEQLVIFYILKIGLSYLNGNVPITLTGDDLDLSGNLRMGATLRSLGIEWSGLTPVFGTSTLINEVINSNIARTYFRDVSSANNTYTLVDVNNSLNTVYRNATGLWTSNFGVVFNGSPVSNTSGGPNAVGFVDSTRRVELNVYPNHLWNGTNGPTNTSIIGPAVSNVYRYNYTANDNGASIILRYYFPAHSSSRSACALRLWGMLNNVFDNSGFGNRIYSNNLYIRFTQNDFATDRDVTIPAGKPVVFNLKWEFVRI